jgi:hypothetical protein
MSISTIGDKNYGTYLLVDSKPAKPTVSARVAKVAQNALEGTGRFFSALSRPFVEMFTEFAEAPSSSPSYPIPVE